MEETQSKQYGLGQKIAFSTGSFSQWFLNSAFNTWIFAFYFSAVGLNVAYITLAFVLWTIWNSINDPLVGYLSDRIRTRWGRRKPFIILGSIPALIINIIIWTPPLGNDFITFIYLLVMLMLYDTFYTMVTLIDTVFPELYTSKEERAQVNSYKQILSMVGLISAFLIPGFFIGSIYELSGYMISGIVTTIIVAISLVITIIGGIREREEFKLDHKHDFSFLQGMKYTLKNRGFVMYTAMFFLFEYITLLYGSVIPLWGEIVLGSAAFETSLLLGVIFIVGLFSVVLWRFIDVKIGSRKGYGIAMIAFIIVVIPILFIDNYIAALLTLAIDGIGFGGMMYFIWLFIADVIDEDEVKNGVRREGTFIGSSIFFMRLAMVFSILTIGTVFIGTGWGEWTLNPNADAVLGIKLIMVLFPAIAIGFSFLCLYIYPFSKQRVDEIKQAMAKLHREKLNKISSL